MFTDRRFEPSDVGAMQQWYGSRPSVSASRVHVSSFREYRRSYNLTCLVFHWETHSFVKLVRIDLDLLCLLTALSTTLRIHPREEQKVPGSGVMVT
jgi:hypothetical protein